MRYDEKITSSEQGVALDALPQKYKCHKQHKSTNFLARTFVPLCAFVARRTSPGGQLQARERAIMKISLQEVRIAVCALTHIREVHIRDISKFGQNSIQIGIRFGFNDRVTVAGFRFKARAIKNCNHSSTVTN